MIGPVQEKLSRNIRKNGLTHSVTMLGAVDHNSERLVYLYQLADIFVIASANETQSIATLEAMAAGKPIIAVKGGALPELVKDGKNGLLFEQNRPDILASLVTLLLKNATLRKRMGEESIKLAARHDINKSLKLYESLYAKCAEKL